MIEANAHTQLMAEYIDAKHTLIERKIAAAIAKSLIFVGLSATYLIMLYRNEAYDTVSVVFFCGLCATWVVPLLLLVVFFEPRVSKADRMVAGLRSELFADQQ